MFVYATGYVTRWLELTNESQKNYSTDRDGRRRLIEMLCNECSAFLMKSSNKIEIDCLAMGKKSEGLGKGRGRGLSSCKWEKTRKHPLRDSGKSQAPKKPRKWHC